MKQFHPHIVVLTVISNDVDDDLDRGLFVLNPNGEVRPVRSTSLPPKTVARESVVILQAYFLGMLTYPSILNS